VHEGNKLTALEVTKRKKPGRYSDGHGLWLQISSSGTKAWLFRYMIDGRARHMGLGPLHTVSLAEARTRARQARQLILDGKDPIEVKYEARDARRSPGAMVFKEAAQRFIEVHDPTWRSPRHRQQSLLRDHASSLANRPISAIDGALITSTVGAYLEPHARNCKEGQAAHREGCAMGPRRNAYAKRQCGASPPRGNGIR